MPQKPPSRVVADRLEATFRRRLLAAIETVRDGADVAALETALRTGSMAEIGRLIDRLSVALGPVAAVMRHAYEQTAELEAALLSTRLSATMAFDAANPFAVAWADRAAARLVTQVSEETRQAIRLMIRESIADGISWVRTARRIRETIGLTDRLAEAVINYSRRLAEAGRAEAQIDRMTQRYFHKLLTYRSEMIARTEIITASNAGQQALWRQARDRGLIQDAHTARIWIVTPDDRLCAAICEPMADQRAGPGLDVPFTTGEGEEVDQPPAHPNCRCAMALDVDYAPARAGDTAE